MKKILALILCLFLASCYTFNRSGFVSQEVEDIYFSSVSVTNDVGRSSGSGTIIWNKGGDYLMVITSAHVIKSMQKRKRPIHITFTYSSAIKPMRVVRMDEKKDLALLMGCAKEVSDGPYVRVATQSPNIGDDVWAIGTPMSVKSTVTKGNLSNFVWEQNPKRLTYRFTADVFFGNSGGGVFNEKGELVGVVDSISFLRMSIFSRMLIPGGNYAVALEEIRKFL